eukprot:14128-Heterococcus_DN1.PRE.4
MEAQVEAANRQTGASLTLRSTESSALISGALAVGIASSTCADIQSSCTWLAVENLNSCVTHLYNNAAAAYACEPAISLSDRQHYLALSSRYGC